jgi:hypothetical protein
LPIISLGDNFTNRSIRYLEGFSFAFGRVGVAVINSHLQRSRYLGNGDIVGVRNHVSIPFGVTL